MTTAPTPAVILVDGEVFLPLDQGDDFRALFDETVKNVGGEVAASVQHVPPGATLNHRGKVNLAT